MGDNEDVALGLVALQGGPMEAVSNVVDEAIDP